ncbi:NADH:ubiquinone reductase (Na(+)-transporting) subunit F [Elusimicrobiota bacterium]
MDAIAFIGLSVLVFTGVIVLLVIVLMIAEKRMVKGGDVRILINNDESKSPIVSAGSTLLSTLAGCSVFLPSACGGGGTCGQCKCQVTDGGGDVLATETGQLTRAQQKDYYRLACQVKVKNDLKIKVPEEIFSIKKYACKVRSNNNVASFIKELVLELPKGEILDFKSGGYIQIDIPQYSLSYKEFDVAKQYHDEWAKFGLWNLKAENDEPIFRAYSMASYPAENDIVMLNVRIASPPPRQMHLPPGKASSYIFNLKPGDDVMISGPYGEFFINETDREMLYIGGGAGMAPMRSHVMHLFKTQKTKRKVSFWYGARSLREIFYEDDFKRITKEFPNFTYNIALSEPLPEDNWKGLTGFIHAVILKEYLNNHPDPTEIEYYLCGPPLMIKACKKMFYDLGVEDEMIRMDEF